MLDVSVLKNQFANLLLLQLFLCLDRTEKYTEICGGEIFCKADTQNITVT